MVVSNGISLFCIFISLMPLLCFPQGYGEEGLYSEQEQGIASGPIFGPGLVGKNV